MKHCPRCDDNLALRRLGSVTLDVCPSCAGIWFDEKELTQIAGVHSAALAKLEDLFVPTDAANASRSGGAGLCPNCILPLFEFEFRHSPGVTLDGCKECKGIWVDDGELRAIWERTQAPPEPGASRPTSVSMSTVRATVVATFLVKIPCPVCGERNPASALVCWACQGVLKGRRGAMLCPHCSGRLVKLPWGELSLDKCQSCGGLWLDDKSLRRLLGQGGPDPGAAPTEPAHAASGRFAMLETPGDSGLPEPTPQSDRKLCPVCQQELRAYQYAYSSGIQLDKCPSCQGVWVDAGELEEIQRFLFVA